MKVKRPRLLAILPQEAELLDLSRLLAGELVLRSEDRLVVASPLDGRTQPVSADEVAAFVAIPSSRWTPVDRDLERLGVSRETVTGLVERGLLLTDGAGEHEQALREANERLAAAGWERFAALYHGMGKWRGRTASLVLGPVEAQEDVVDGFRLLEKSHGPSPPAFHERSDTEGAVELPPGHDGDSALLSLLARRRSVRWFDRERSMAVEDLATLLASVFGVAGGLQLSSTVTVVKKSSPSGGGLHPIEAYPLIRDVGGVEPGLYHYNVRRHRLDLLRRLASDEAAELAERLLARQSYFASAHAVVLLTARFERNFWKYREHQKAYRVVLMDAAHLSQTFYLMCAEMGLGACFTAAINDADVDEALGLDGWREGAVAALACGPPAADDAGLTFRPGPLP